MSNLTYEASVFSRTVKYTNFKGETNETTLYFALDPLELMKVIASVGVKTSKSNNPALKGKPEPLSDDAQVQLVRDLAIKSAGFPSEDGEVWEPFENFGNTIAGKAFLTQLASSDGTRREFAEKVILDPFRAFVAFAEADPTNSRSDIQQFQGLQSQLESAFAPKDSSETLEDRKARLQAELEAMGNN